MKLTTMHELDTEISFEPKQSINYFYKGLILLILGTAGLLILVGKFIWKMVLYLGNVFLKWGEKQNKKVQEEHNELKK